MKIRITGYDAYQEWYEEKFREGKAKGLHELNDKDFMEIYSLRGYVRWCFDSLEEFVTEFNEDGAYAPTPSEHIIHFFTSE